MLEVPTFMAESETVIHNLEMLFERFGIFILFYWIQSCNNHHQVSWWLYWMMFLYRLYIFDTFHHFVDPCHVIVSDDTLISPSPDSLWYTNFTFPWFSTLLSFLLFLQVLVFSSYVQQMGVLFLKLKLKSFFFHPMVVVRHSLKPFIFLLSDLSCFSV